MGRPRFGRPDEGIAGARQWADTQHMIWPVAALAVFLLGFVVVYGSVLQARTETGLATGAREDALRDTDAA
jgi:hypothetical protein